MFLALADGLAWTKCRNVKPFSNSVIMFNSDIKRQNRIRPENYMQSVFK